MKLLENGAIEENYRTSFTHCGINGVLTNKSYLLLMENIAGIHSNYFHFTFSDLAKDNLTWVILNWKLKVIKRLGPDQNIRIQTWGRFFNRVFVIRDFKIYDEQNDLCAVASSKWCLVNFKTGKIAPMPKNIDQIYGKFNPESVFNIEDLPRIIIPNNNPISNDTYKIRRFDLDNNKHVHNLNYINFAYEVLPEDVFLGYEYNNLEIIFKKEIRYGETINSFIHNNENNNGYTIEIKSLDEKVTHSIVKLY